MSATNLATLSFEDYEEEDDDDDLLKGFRCVVWSGLWPGCSDGWGSIKQPFVCSIHSASACLWLPTARWSRCLISNGCGGCLEKEWEGELRMK